MYEARADDYQLAFFTALRANLTLPDANFYVASPLPSPPPNTNNLPSTPLLLPLAIIPLPSGNAPLKPIHTARSTHIPPPYRPYLTTSPTSRTAALSLTRKGVAAQSLVALLSLLRHPLNITISLLILLFLQKVVLRHVYHLEALHVFAICVTLSLILVSIVAVALWLRYRRVASYINCEWLGDDEVIVVEDTRGNVIGALILTLVGGYGKGRRKRSIGRGCIRAWTVCQGHHGKGIGKSLLREAAAVVRSRGGCGVEFDAGHACEFFVFFIWILTRQLEAKFCDNGSPDAERVLPKYYSSVFVKRDRRVCATLAAIMAGGGGKRR